MHGVATYITVHHLILYTLAVYWCAGNVVNSVSIIVAVIIIIRVLNVHISRPCLLSMHMFSVGKSFPLVVRVICSHLTVLYKGTQQYRALDYAMQE